MCPRRARVSLHVQRSNRMIFFLFFFLLCSHTLLFILYSNTVHVKIIHKNVHICTPVYTKISKHARNTCPCVRTGTNAATRRYDLGRYAAPKIKGDARKRRDSVPWKTSRVGARENRRARPPGKLARSTLFVRTRRSETRAPEPAVVRRLREIIVRVPPRPRGHASRAVWYGDAFRQSTTLLCTPRVREREYYNK